MKAVLETLEGNKVKLSIQVDEQEFEKDIDAAFRKIAREVRIPGFRPGKAPRRILEARLGKETGRSEALREALPAYYTQAVRDHEVDVVAAPELDITSGEDSGGVSFDAVVEVRPEIHLAGYGGLRVTVPSPVASDEDIDAQLDRLRGNFGELVEVGRPVKAGDFVTVNLSGTRDGEPIPQLDLEDFSYEAGSDSLLPGLDPVLDGAKVGDILEFDADLGDEGPASVKVLVKEVKEKKLPDLTDEWASEASEFDTVAELRADIAKRMGVVRRVQATLALRNSALEALVELVADDPPASLVDAEVERQLHDLQHRLEAQGATIAGYLQATGQAPEELVESLRQQAAPSVKADLALRAVAKAEGVEPTEDDIDAEVRRLAEAYKIKPAEARRNLERADQMPAVRSDWKKSRALDWLLEHVEIVDEEGKPVDRSLLEPNIEPNIEADPQPADSHQADIAEADTAEDGEGSTPAAGSTAGAAESATEAPVPDVPQDEETGEQ
ncbi:MAG TPA: trigger factor [Acidimicrobiales bacterium]|nr:trigger factor [Acidimicrobiales bacterium]